MTSNYLEAAAYCTQKERILPVCAGRMRDCGFANGARRAAAFSLFDEITKAHAMFAAQGEQAEEDLGGEKCVARRGVAVVRYDLEPATQAVEVEFGDLFLPKRLTALI